MTALHLACAESAQVSSLMKTYGHSLSAMASQSAKDTQTSKSDRPVVNGKQEPAQLKIEIPANRSVGELSHSAGEN